MNWEETIEYIRSKDEYAELVTQAYLSEDLELNVKNFSASIEFLETVKIIDSRQPGPLRILDIGCGNGIASISFAQRGHCVVAVDPDPSLSVGTGAVKFLKDKLDLKNLTVITSTAEDLALDEGSFDLVYCRQALHHANDLHRFVANCSRFLKRNGHFVSIRDHVIIGSRDKKKFLNEHPLHKFYFGENAYQSSEYRKAMRLAGLEIVKELRFFDSVINLFPLSLSSITDQVSKEKKLVRQNLEKRLGALGRLSFINYLYTTFIFDPDDMNNERYYSGRMYSYFCVKR